MRTPYVIAEFGSSHEGDLARALKGVEVAAECDADAFKVQYWSAPERMRARRKVWDPFAYRTGSVDKAWLPELAAACTERDLDFLCTTYCLEDIQVVEPYVPAFKVSSFEAGDKAFIDAHAQFGKHLLVSTGMMADVPEYLHEHTLLHCVSAYPTPPEQAGLGAIVGANLDGYSDHTQHEWMGALAVAAGAYYVEVHFCLNETSEGCPDVVVSHRPEGLRRYIQNLRLAHAALGGGVKRVQEVEMDNLKHRVTG